MEDTTLIGQHLSATALLLFMQALQFILESNSNKRLDALSKEIIFCIRSTGAIKAGPIAFKNKRIIYCYQANLSTLSRLMSLKDDKRVDVTINSLQNPQ